MFARILFAAVVAGLAAGLVMTAIQQWRVLPLILEAELYEGVHVHEDGTVHDHGATAEADTGVWAPADGLERTAYTVLANLLVSVGFALVLAAISLVVRIEVTSENALLWGLAGFITFQLAPAFGLPPELPGMPAADLEARQVWWWATVVDTGAALLILAKWRNAIALPVAAALLLAPHIVGAPHPETYESAVPAGLANQYAAAVLVTGAVFWLVLGPALVWANALVGRRLAST